LRPITKPKKNTMKKLFAILAVAGVMAACNNGDEKKTDTPTDSSKMATDAMKTDSTVNTKIDSAKSAVSAAQDTMAKAADKMQDMKKDASKMMDKAADKMKDASKMMDKAKEAVKQ
jgi:hypothetical protein